MSQLVLSEQRRFPVESALSRFSFDILGPRSGFGRQLRRLANPLTYDDVTAVQAISGPNIMPATNSEVESGRNGSSTRENASRLVRVETRLRDGAGPRADVAIDMVKRRM